MYDFSSLFSTNNNLVFINLCVRRGAIVAEWFTCSSSSWVRIQVMPASQQYLWAGYELCTALRVDFEDHYVQARVEHRLWCINPGFKTHGQSQPKSKTENTSGSTKTVIGNFFFLNKNRSIRTWAHLVFSNKIWEARGGTYSIPSYKPWQMRVGGGWGCRLNLAKKDFLKFLV